MKFTTVLWGGIVALALTCVSANAQTAVDINAKGSPLVLCTGASDGFYAGVGKEIKDNLGGKLKVVIEPSAGSEENLRRMSGMEATDNEGKPKPACNAGIIQSDAQLSFKANYKGAGAGIREVGPLFQEVFHLVCNKDTGIKKIKDLYGRKDVKVAIDKPGSGTAVTWSNFIRAEKRYGDIVTVPDGGTFALNDMKAGEIGCMAFVSGIGTGRIKTAEDQSLGKLRLVDLNDGDLTDVKDPKGNKIYRWTKISNQYPNLYSSWTSSLDTIGMNAILVVNNDWARANENGFTDLSRVQSQLGKRWLGQ